MTNKNTDSKPGRWDKVAMVQNWGSRMPFESSIDGFDVTLTSDESGVGGYYTASYSGVLMAKGWIRIDHLKNGIRHEQATTQTEAIVRTLTKPILRDALRAAADRTDDIEALRAFAVAHATTMSEYEQHGQFAAFAHMCTSALLGETWAIERVTKALEEITYLSGVLGWTADAAKLSVIGETDTARPDGAIARTIKI